MSEVLSDAQMFFELTLTRVLNRRSVLVGKVTIAQRREAMRALIIETGIKDQLMPQDGDNPRVSWRHQFNAVYFAGAR